MIKLQFSTLDSVIEPSANISAYKMGSILQLMNLKHKKLLIALTQN